MCYSPEMSFGFALLGIGAILYLRNDTQHKYISYLIFFYVLMELLQTVQYYLVNDCENIWNRLLTEVAYLFVIVQPLLWNSYFYFNSIASELGLFKVGIALSIAWITVSLIGRLLYKVVGTDHPWDSWFYGDKVCTYKGASHLYWKWTSANLGDLHANFLMHMLIWFIPALLSVTHYTAALLVMAGAIISAGITGYMGDIQAFPSAWCYISIPLVGLIIGKDILHYNRGTGKA